MRTTVASASPFTPGLRRGEAVRLRRSGSGAAHGGGALCEHPNIAGPTPANPTIAAVLASPVNPEPIARMFGAGSLPVNGRTAQAKGHGAPARPPRVRAGDHSSLDDGRAVRRPARVAVRRATTRALAAAAAIGGRERLDVMVTASAGHSVAVAPGRVRFRVRPLVWCFVGF